MVDCECRFDLLKVIIEKKKESKMKIIRTVKEMHETTNQFRQAGKQIGFVPTMGYLHEGHLSLMRAAKKRSDVLIVSIYVNPTQFAPNEDLDQYPRDLEYDQQQLETVGCDVLFLPSNEIMYPPPYHTYVMVEELTQTLCGASRPTHFRGVTTIVTKLFNCVKPHIAVFGQKDAQQAIILKRMVQDLNMDIEMIISPIVRELDGLAMSSRNTYLSENERKDALVLSQALHHAQDQIQHGERNANRLINEMVQMISTKPTTKIDYVSIVDTTHLKPVETIEGEILIAMAVFVGKTRLIDNVMINI